MGEVGVVAYEVGLRPLGARRDREVDDDLEADLVRPVEGVVDLGKAAHDGPGARAVGAEDVPGDGQAHRIEAAGGDLVEVGLAHESGAVSLEAPAVLVAADGADERALIERAGVGKKGGRDPCLEREPSGEIHAMQSALRHRSLLPCGCPINSDHIRVYAQRRTVTPVLLRRARLGAQRAARAGERGAGERSVRPLPMRTHEFKRLLVNVSYALQSEAL